MADPLYELLTPYFEISSSPNVSSPSPNDATTKAYLNRLTTLSLTDLRDAEPQSLAQSSQSLLLSLQKLSARSHKPVISSTSHLSTLRTSLPALARSTAELRDSLPKLDDEAVRFSETYNKNAENEVLDRRRKSLLLSRNVDRLADILDLPTLLSSAILSSAATSSSSSAAAVNSSNYALALDLNAHIRRLHTLYPDSKVIASVSQQADEAMQSMTTNLIASLRVQGVKLAAAMRTVSWLRRVAPELEVTTPGPDRDREGGVGALFLVCRLANLMMMLQALEPLRDLADQETQRRKTLGSTGNPWSGGQQTERYLKRYVEIFREQSFAIISMYRSIFPSTTDHDSASKGSATAISSDPLQPLPSALSTFPLHLVDMLTETLKHYLPNVQDRASKDSLLTQVLYCAGSLGRLGRDFSMILADLEDDEEDEDWVDVMKKHKVLAGKLEMMMGPKT